MRNTYRRLRHTSTTRLQSFDDMDEYKHLPGNMKSTLIELNIADDYFKAKALVEKLEGDIENKDKEIYDLKA